MGNFCRGQRRTPVARKSRVTRAHSLCVHTSKHHGSQINATRFAGGCLFKKLPVTSRAIHFRRFAGPHSSPLRERMLYDPISCTLVAYSLYSTSLFSFFLFGIGVSKANIEMI